MKDETKWGAAIATLELTANEIENDPNHVSENDRNLMRARVMQLRAAAEFLQKDNNTIHIGVDQSQTETEKVREEWVQEYVNLRNMIVAKTREIIAFMGEDAFSAVGDGGESDVESGAKDSNDPHQRAETKGDQL